MTGEAGVVNLRELAARIEFELRSQPSKARLLIDAVRQIELGLGVLASAGWTLHVRAGAKPVIEWPWPRIYYHYEHGHREVLAPGDLAELGPGWYPSFAEAEQAYGEDVQFAGRGGVRRHRELTLVNGESESRWVPIGPSPAELKAEFLKSRKERANGSGFE